MTQKRLTIVLCIISLTIACSESTSAPPSVHERWYREQAGFGYPRPVVAANRSFFGTGDGAIVARDPATGGELWSATISGGSIGGANMVVRGDVLVVPTVHETVALDATSGRVLWRYEAPLDTIGTTPQGALPGQVYWTHLDADAQTVFIPAWGASVSAVDVLTGAVRWIWEPGRMVTDTATSGPFRSGSGGVRVSGDTVYAAGWHRRDVNGQRSEAWLVALDRASGRELWRRIVPTTAQSVYVGGAPVVAGDRVIFSSVGGHEYGYNRFSGDLAWEYTPATTNSTNSETELYDGVVYHDGGDHFIYALRANDGGVLWRAPFPSQTNTDLLVTSRRVMFSEGRRLYILDRETGRQILNVQQPRTLDPFFASPAASSNGQVFLTVNGGAWSFDEP